MTNEILQQIAKENKINLDWFSHVNCFASLNYKHLYIIFGLAENVGGGRYYYGQTMVKKSLTNIMFKREENEQDYFTNGWEPLYEIKAN